jgi:hypothetical protein
LILEIAEQVRGTGMTGCLLAHFLHHLHILGTDKDTPKMCRTIFRSVSSGCATGKFKFHLNPMLREEGDDHSDDSKIEVEGKKGRGEEDC